MPPGQRPGWIVNVTNDGWFGNSTGPYQHLQQARVTAIELGLPLARAANTGISAVIDPVGRVINSLPLGTEGVLDAPLPRAIGAPIYAQARRPAGLHHGGDRVCRRRAPPAGREYGLKSDTWSQILHSSSTQACRAAKHR